MHFLDFCLQKGSLEYSLSVCHSVHSSVCLSFSAINFILIQLSLPSGYSHPPQATCDCHYSSLGLSDQRQHGLDTSQHSQHINIHGLPECVHANPLYLTKCCPASIVHYGPEATPIIDWLDPGPF